MKRELFHRIPSSGRDFCFDASRVSHASRGLDSGQPKEVEPVLRWRKLAGTDSGVSPLFKGVLRRKFFVFKIGAGGQKRLIAALGSAPISTVAANERRS